MFCHTKAENQGVEKESSNLHFPPCLSAPFFQSVEKRSLLREINQNVVTVFCHVVKECHKQLFLFLSWCFTSTETVRLIRDGGMEVGKEGDYVPIATLLLPE